jgi:hypothetical protein
VDIGVSFPKFRVSPPHYQPDGDRAAILRG